MKRILCILLLICISLSAAACGNGAEQTTSSDTTDQMTDTTYTGTVTDLQTNDTDTSEPPFTDTDTEPETDETTAKETDPVTTEKKQDGPEVKAEYKLYDPCLASSDYKGTIMLFDDGGYVIEFSHTNTASDYKVHVSYTERGTYRMDGTSDIFIGVNEAEVEMTFDDEQSKEACQNSIDAAHRWGDISDLAYGVFKSALNGGYKGKAAGLEDKKIYGSLSSDIHSQKAVCDGGVAYLLIFGMAAEENEYYITENDYTLALYEDGTCRMFSETVKKDGDWLGQYIVYDSYEGTYELSGDTVSATFTKNTTKRRFMSEEDGKNYRDFIEDQYNGGKLSKVYYDYYISLISDTGYSETDNSDKYIIEIEKHTHTAVISESPDSET